MAVSKREWLEIEYFILKEVFSKITFDKIKKQFVIRLEDYIPLNLSLNHMRKLEEMCKQHNIELEMLPPKISREEASELFKELKTLKLSNDSKTIKRQEELIHKLTLGYMSTVYKWITKKIPDINITKNKEDIYQLGYEVLLELIKRYDPSKELPFDNFIRLYLIHHLKAKRLEHEKDLTKSICQDLYTINLATERLGISKKDEKAPKIISEATGIKESRVKNILISEELSEYDSIEDYDKESLKYDNIPIIDEEILNRGINENLVMILDLLPPIQKEIILDYYGFTDGKIHRLEEIGQKLGISSERTRQLRNDGIRTLKLPIFIPYINNHEQNIDIEFFLEYIYRTKSQPTLHQVEYIERQLIKYIPEEIITKIINTLEPIEREVFLLNYGLKDGICYHLYQIKNILGISVGKLEKQMFIIRDIVAKCINEGLDKSYGNSYIEKMISNYLEANRKRIKR